MHIDPYVYEIIEETEKFIIEIYDEFEIYCRKLAANQTIELYSNGWFSINKIVRCRSPTIKRKLICKVNLRREPEKRIGFLFNNLLIINSKLIKNET